MHRSALLQGKQRVENVKFENRITLRNTYSIPTSEPETSPHQAALCRASELGLTASNLYRVTGFTERDVRCLSYSIPIQGQGLGTGLPLPFSYLYDKLVSVSI
jgi:hypothetical protein